VLVAITKISWSVVETSLAAPSLSENLAHDGNYGQVQEGRMGSISEAFDDPNQTSTTQHKQTGFLSVDKARKVCASNITTML